MSSGPITSSGTSSFAAITVGGALSVSGGTTLNTLSANSASFTTLTVTTNAGASIRDITLPPGSGWSASGAPTRSNANAYIVNDPGSYMMFVGSGTSTRYINMWDQVNVNGGLSVSGTATFAGISITNLNIAGSATIGGNLNVAGTFSTGAITASGTSTFAAATVSGSATVGATLSAQTLVNSYFDFNLGLGDQSSRGNSGSSRALVKAGGPTLYVNYGNDFTGGTVINSALAVTGTTQTANLGVNVAPAVPLDVFIPGGVGGWDRFQVTTSSLWGDSGTQYVTIGTGASGVMLHNPHITWAPGNGAATIRMGRSGSVSSGYFYEVAVGGSNDWYVGQNGASRMLSIAQSGLTTLSAGLTVNGATTTLNADLFVNGYTTLSGIGASVKELTLRPGAWGTSGQDRSSTSAYIIDDNAGYNALMIVGANPSASNRKIRMWDEAYVHGIMTVDSTFTAGSGVVGGVDVGGSVSTLNSQMSNLMSRVTALEAKKVVYTSTFSQYFSTSNTRQTEWNTFAASISASVTYNTLRIYGTFDSTGHTCTGANANLLCQAIRSGASTVTYSCSGRTWMYCASCCGGSELSSFGTQCICDTGYTIRPGLSGNFGNFGGQSNCNAAAQTMTVICSSA
eukprot:TRINITY_DN217_c0_g1_i1.p1 TRINITY_DN217_c0_g1~~TRINITY_DN217_c0_g1_i1.p1  ORF type:complete len:626 (+),score=0.20 TRINITY_DN217_c0_g1_i1:358-2235(+)